MGSFMEEVMSPDDDQVGKKITIDIPTDVEDSINLVIQTSEEGHTILTDCEDAAVAVEELVDAIAPIVGETYCSEAQLEGIAKQLTEIHTQFITADVVVSQEDGSNDGPSLKTRAKEFAVKAYHKLKTAFLALVRWIRLFFKQMSHACRGVMKDYDRVISALERDSRFESDVEMSAVNAYNYFYVGRKNDQLYGKQFYDALLEFYKAIPSTIKASAIEIEKAGQKKPEGAVLLFKDTFPSFYSQLQSFIKATEGTSAGKEYIVQAPMNKNIVLTEDDNGIRLDIADDRDVSVSTGKVKVPKGAVIENLKIIRNMLGYIVRKEDYIDEFERMVEKQLKLLELMEAENIEKAVKATGYLKTFFTRTIQKFDPYAIRMSHGMLRAMQSTLQKEDKSND